MKTAKIIIMTQKIDIIVSMQRPFAEHNLINLSNDNISDLCMKVIILIKSTKYFNSYEPAKLVHAYLSLMVCI